MSNHRLNTPGHSLLLIAFGAIAVLIGWDLMADYAEGVEALHVAVELTVLVLAAGMFGYVVTQLLWGRRQLTQMHRRLDSVAAESRRWRERYQTTIRGLGAAIQEQFEAWKLSAAEAEIGLLLLKGLSLKEIAAVRETGERTVREQARAIYRKAGLSGRSELSAFFLEDLLLPDPSTLEENPAEPPADDGRSTDSASG